MSDSSSLPSRPSVSSDSSEIKSENVLVSFLFVCYTTHIHCKDMKGLSVCVCVCVGGGGGVTSYIWHSMGVHAKWCPFSVLPGFMNSPLFSSKCI